MLIIYQIGNYRVNLVASDLQGLGHSAPVKFRRASETLTGVSGDITLASVGRPLVSAGKIKVEGSLICGANDTCESVDQQFNQLIANSGMVVPIIAVVPPECCPCQKCKGAGCPDCTTKPESMWLVSYGMVTDYTADYKQDVGGRFGDGALPVSLSIEGVTYWEPLNDVEWKYYGREKPLYALTTSTIDKHSHPYMPRFNAKPDSGFRRVVGDTEIMYNPANWAKGYSRVLKRRARANMLTSDDTTPTVTLVSGVPHVHTVDLPYLNWPAQPRSMYYFDSFPILGTITIEVEAETTGGLRTSNTAVLDLEELFSNPYFTPVPAYDALIAGPINGSFNGEYLLGGNTSADVYVPWVKTGLSPGEVYVGRNTVTVTFESIIPGATIDYSYLHIYRRY